MISQLKTDLNNQIKAENRAREENEEQFIVLLEATCAKIEGNISYDWKLNFVLFIIFKLYMNI